MARQPDSVAGYSIATERQYRFIDAVPLPANFYRLRTTGSDNAISFSSVVAYKLNQPAEFLLFPNPATTVVHLQYSTKEQTMAQIVDAAGRVVKTITLPEGENALTVDIAGLNPVFTG